MTFAAGNTGRVNSGRALTVQEYTVHLNESWQDRYRGERQMDMPHSYHSPMLAGVFRFPTLLGRSEAWLLNQMKTKVVKRCKDGVG
jgi:hypothetical protein